MESELPDATVIWHYMPLWKFERALSKEPCSKGIKRCALWFSRPFAFRMKWKESVPTKTSKGWSSLPRRSLAMMGSIPPASLSIDDELLERIEANKEINESELSRGRLAG